MADYPEPPPKRGRWQRILGGPQSWRRMIALGVVVGVAFAIVGALIAVGFGGGGNSSLDNKPDPTSIASGGPDDGGGLIEEEPTDLPVFETPTEVPIDQPTDEPVATEPAPTEPADEATPTEESINEPTPVLTVVGGA